MEEEKFNFDADISIFKSTLTTYEPDVITIKNVLNNIRDGIWKSEINNYRNGDDSVKRNNLPTIAFHGKFHDSRHKSDFYDPTGIIIIDIDDIDDDLEEVKEDIMLEYSQCIAAMVSPSGTGIKLLYWVPQELITKDSYSKIGKIVSKKFSEYGKIDVLSVTDCLIATYDPNLIINEKPVVDIDIKLSDLAINCENIKLEVLDKSRELWDDPEEFFEKVLLNQIEEKSDNNYHFIQMSVFDLAKYGFRSPDYDLDFIINYSESTHKESDENEERLRGSVFKAEDIQQSKWPYKGYGDEKKLGKVRRVEGKDEKKNVSEFDEPYADYNDESVPEDGLIDYSNIAERVDGVIDQGDYIGAEISLSNFARIFRFKTGGLLTLTGIPTHGKTEFADQIMVDLARLFGWKSLVAGFEQTPEEHIVKLMRKMLGFNISSSDSDKSQKNKARDFVTRNIKHIDVDNIGGNIGKILNYAKICVEKYGFKILILDPYNMLTIKSRSISDNAIANDILRSIVAFAKKYDVLVILIAHPTKLEKDKKTGLYPVVTFYNVKGSSAFFEMSYHGLSIYRDDNEDIVKVVVLKVKQNNLGLRNQEAILDYDISSGRYIPLDTNYDKIEGDWNSKKWLDKTEF